MRQQLGVVKGRNPTGFIVYPTVGTGPLVFHRACVYLLISIESRG